MAMPENHRSSFSAAPAPPPASGRPTAPGAALLRDPERPLWWRLLAAALVVAAAALVRHVVLGEADRGLHYTAFYTAVLLAALHGGLAAGALAGAFSALFVVFALPHGTFGPADGFALTAFLLGSAIASALGELLHRSQRSLRREIRERATSEAALRESRERHRSILENLDAAILLTKPDGSILSANPAACRLFGRTEEEICRIGRTGLVDSDDSRLAPLLAQRAEHGRCRGPLTYLRADGTRFEGECASSLFTDASGRTCTSMVIRDLTTQHLAAARLTEAAAQWQSTFDAIRDAVWVLDRECRVTHANRAAAELLHRGIETMIGRHCWEIVHGARAPIDDCPLQQAARTLQRAVTELALGERWFEVVVDPILAADGRFAGAVHTMTDITAHRLAEADRSLLAAAIGASRNEIYLIDAESLRCCYVNRGAAESLGYTTEQLHQLTPLDFVPDFDRSKLTDLMAPLRRAEVPLLTFVTRHRRADGTTYPVEVHLQLLRHEGRELFLGVANDITARRRLEDSLRESERFTRATIDALSAHLCVLDAQGVILATNKAWRDFTAANPPVPANCDCGANYLAVCDSVTGADRPAAHAFADGLRAVLHGTAESFELEYSCHSPAEQRWFLARVTRFADTSSGPLRTVVVHENISARKRAENALRTAQADLERLVHARTAALESANALLDQTGQLARVGGWEHDLRTGAVNWTLAVRQIHEVDDTYQPTPASLIDFYEPAVRPRVAAALQALRTDGTPFDLELPFASARATPLWLRTTGQAYRDNGVIVRIGGVIQDITTRRRAEDALRQQRDQLEQLLAERTAANARLRELDRLKSEFLSTMSHELRTPLNSIVGFTGILLKGLAGPLNPEQHKQLTLVQSSSRHLLALINDLLDLSRIESGRIELQRESFDFAEVVAEVAAFLQPVVAQKPVALRHDCAPAALPLVGDRRRSLQVLLNLATNAVKFTEHGEVALAARLEAGRIAVTVRDTGIGIRPDQMPHLFEAFRQLDASARRHYEGTGLGLHLSRKLLELLGGTIAVESAPGVGSTFTFTLPLAPP